MIQKMIATYEIKKTVYSGERYICDQCGSSIFDSTQCEDTVSYKSLPSIQYFRVKMGVHTDERDVHACSQECVKQLFDLWQSEETRFKREHPDCVSSGKFDVWESTIFPENVLNEYKPNDISIEEWNKVKKEKSRVSIEF